MHTLMLLAFSPYASYFTAPISVINRNLENLLDLIPHLLIQTFCSADYGSCGIAGINTMRMEKICEYIYRRSV